jgi:ABC-type Na+ efflux pump permease subunit
MFPGPSLDVNPVLWREWHRNRPSRWTRIVWGLYALASVCCLVAILAICVEGSRMRMELATVMLGGLVALGLLLLSISAPTSLAEERTQGSLDVLMATPLSTASIVWGKWWGTFRVVPLMAIVPGVTTTALGVRHGTLLGPLLEVGLVLACGAALTSLGLALATWMPRPNRALAVTVTAYILVTVGWFFLALVLTMHSPGVTGPALASASPFIGAIFPAIQMQHNSGSDWEVCVFSLSMWITLYIAVAVVLLLATLATFDRCLGRMSALSVSAWSAARLKPAAPSAVALE